MTVKTIENAATAAERQCRAIADEISARALAGPGDELLDVRAQIARQIVVNAAMRADLIPAGDAASLMAGAFDLLNQADDGLLGRDDGLERVAQVELQLAVYVAQHRRAAWEAVVDELVTLRQEVARGA